MSRRRTRVQTPAPRATTPATSAVTRGDPRERDLTELHRLAVERREYRIGRGPRPASPAPPDDVRTVTSGDGTISTTVPVKGMTCRSCEVRIQRHVGRLPSVERVTASAVLGRVEIQSIAPIPAAMIVEAIGKAGYEVGRTPWLERDPKVWGTAAAGVLLVGALAFLAQATGLGNLASGAGDLSKGGIAVALLLGLAAGVSTCMALVGGLVLGLSAAFKARSVAVAGDGQRLAMQMRPAVVFIGGRIGGYALFGATLGALGASLTLPPR
jgi:uncharacterized protein